MVRVPRAGAGLEALGFRTPSWDPSPPPAPMRDPRRLAFAAIGALSAVASLVPAQAPAPTPGPLGPGPTVVLAASPKSLVPSPFAISNGLLRLEFSQTQNRIEFVRLVKLAGGLHTFQNDTPWNRFWEVGLRQLPIQQGTGVWPVLAKVYPSSCVGPASRGTVVSGPTTTLWITWNDCRPVASDPTNWFNVTLRITLTAGDPISRWTLEVENHLPDWALFYTSLLHGFAQEPQDTYLVVPATGRLIRNPHSTLAPNPTGSPNAALPYTNWLPFQLFPYYTADGHGVYYATHDGGATFAKFANLYGYGNRYEVQSATYAEDSDATGVGTTFVTPYPIAMGVFNGDWYDAARIYRSWAETQPILEKGKLITRTDVPQWWKEVTLSNVGYVPGNLNATPVVNAYVNKWLAIRAYQGLANDEYYLFQDLWYEPASLGFYTPLQGIGNLFGALRSQGFFVGGRNLSFTYSQTAPPSPCGSAPPNSATLVNGMPDPFDPNGGTHVNPYTPFALCYMEDFIQNRLLPTQAVHFFYDNPYFSDVSYDPAHGNPSGHGGSWLYDRIVDIMEQVRVDARATEPRFVTTHESSFEGYIRCADSAGAGYAFNPPGFVNPANVADEIRIPLQSAIVHDYGILLGANELANWLDLSGVYTDFEDINFVLAHGFIEGRQLNTIEPFFLAGYANHELLAPGSPLAAIPGVAQILVDHTVYLKKLVEVKRTAYGRKYLTYGEFLRPLDIPGLPLVTKTFNPLFIGFGVSYPITSPVVLTSVWRANDGSGDVGIVATNHTNAPVTFTVALDAADYGLDPAIAHTVTRLEPSATTPLATFTGSLSLPITVDAKSVFVVEID